MRGGVGQENATELKRNLLYDHAHNCHKPGIVDPDLLLVHQKKHHVILSVIRHIQHVMEG